MNDTKQHFYKTLNAIVGTHRIDNEEAYIINDYISRLEATIKDEQEEIYKQKEVIDKIKEDIEFCINNLKNEYACTDKRTNRELHTTVKILEEALEKIE